MDVVKNSNKKTPMMTKTGKSGALFGPCNTPNMNPYMSALKVGFKTIQIMPKRFFWFWDWTRALASS
ncbi:hypothetical protein D3C74_452940 [compost metagenome]